MSTGNEPRSSSQAFKAWEIFLAFGIVYVLSATAMVFLLLGRVNELAIQLQERTPKVGVVDVGRPIVEDKDPRVHLKYVTWKDEKGKDQRFACGEIKNNFQNVSMMSREGVPIATVWPEPRLTNAY